MSGMHAGAWEWDHHTRTLWLSPRLYEMVGHGRRRRTSSPAVLLRYIHPDDRNLVKQAMRDRRTSADIFRFDIRLADTAGNYHWFEVYGQQFLADDGTAVSTTGSLIDVDERKRLALHLGRLEELQRHTNRIARVGSWEFDLDADTVLAADEVFLLHGIDPRPTPSARLFLTFYDRRERARIASTFRALQRDRVPFDIRLRMRPRQGSPRWVRVTGEPVFDATGRMVALRGLVMDVDRETTNAMEVRASLAELRTKNEQLEQFAHIVSHNLRTHAGNVASMLTMLEQEQDDHERDEVFRLLRASSNALSETLMILSDAVRTRTGNDRQVAQRVDLQPLIQRTWLVLDRQVRTARATLTTDIAPGLSIDAPEAYLDSIMFNLLSNALKYAHPDRPADIRITASGTSIIMITIADNGLGINLDRNGRNVFGLYKTFHRRADARGIGLFMTRNQVEALGGSIGVASTVDVGTTFTIRLPTTPQAAAPTP